VLDGEGTQLPHGKGLSTPHFSVHLFALALSHTATAELLFFGSVRQIKLAIRQLLGARKYCVS